MSRRPTTASPTKSPKKSKTGLGGGAIPTSADYESMLNDQQHQMSMQISEKEIEIDRLKTSVEVMNNKCSNYDQYVEDLGNSRGKFGDSEQNRVKLQEQITQITITVKEDNVTHSTYQSELTDRIGQLQSELESEKQSQYRKELQWRQDKENMQQDFHNQLQQVNAEKEQVRANLRSELEQVRAQLRNELEQMRQQKDNQIADLEDAFEKYRNESQHTINEQEIKIKQLTQRCLSQQTTILELQQIITKKEDVEAQLATAQQHNAQLIQQKEKVQNDLDQATDYIISLEEKVYKANKTSLELLKQLKDAEVEIETLKQYIIDLKQRIAVYIPVKEDAIDRKLAEFINNYPERSKLKIMFMRESEGVYQFGTKRVAVKVEKDNIKIRVGGGYLSLDEFLDQYTPVELEKLERKDPLKRFSEKIAVQKTIVNAGVRENSPVRSPGRQSPKRKQQI